MPLFRSYINENIDREVIKAIEIQWVLEVKPRAGTAFAVEYDLIEAGIAFEKKVDPSNLRLGVQGELPNPNQSAFGSADYVQYHADMVEYLLRQFDGLGDDKVDSVSFDYMRNTEIINPGSRGRLWRLANQLTDKKSTLAYLEELLHQGFCCIIPTNDGKRKLKGWMEYTTPVAAHDASIIQNGTLDSLGRTPLGRVYSDLTLNYGFDKSTGKYRQTIRVTKADQDSFPTSTEYTNPVTNVPGLGSGIWTAEYGTQLGNQLRFSFDNFAYTLPSELTVGNVLTLIKSNVDPLLPEGFERWEITAVQNMGTYTYIWVEPEEGSTYDITTDGLETITDDDYFVDINTGVLAWKTFAQGFADNEYSLAKSYWESLHDAFS